MTIVIVTILLNVLAWNSSAFCDWYIAHIFPIWLNTYGRITGLFSFSVGEWMLVAGVILVVLAVLLAVVWAVIGLAKGMGYGLDCLKAFCKNRSVKTREEPVSKPKEQLCMSKGGFKRFTFGFYRFFAWTLLGVCLIMTLNCFILYHVSTFSEHYFGEDDGEYELTELIELFNMVAEKCNNYALTIARDEKGVPIYSGTE